MAATTYGDIKEQVQEIVEDERFQSGGTQEDRILKYANDAVVAVARNVIIPEHLADGTVTCLVSGYIYDFPANFLRIHPKKTFAWVNVSGVDMIVPKKSDDYLDAIDPGHLDTTTASTPTYWAVRGQRLLIYPMWAGTLRIRNYLRIPTAMTLTTSSPDLPSESISGEQLTHDIIVNYILGIIYRRFLNEPNLAQPYLTDFQEGLRQLEEYYHLRQFDRKATPG